MLISILSLILFLFEQCQSNPMIKSPEEQQEKTPQFWSFFLQPGQFETKKLEITENSGDEPEIQGKQQKQEEMNTSELGRKE
jgi:hypothetical protein